jgi:LacI family transcriptional regulator
MADESWHGGMSLFEDGIFSKMQKTAAWSLGRSGTMKEASTRAKNKSQKKRATVTDVAEMAQVGASTVSRFLRGVPVRPKVAERVARAVKELCYEPDESARSLRSGRSRTIGVILPKVTNVFFSLCVQRIEEEARQRGCTVVLLTHADRMEQQMAHLATLRRYRTDGVILVGAPGTTLRAVRSAFPDGPVVAFDNDISSGVDAVLLDNRNAAQVATEHLLAHGYSHVACVTGRPEIFSFKERAAGYSAAMMARGLEGDLIVAADYDRLRSLLGEAIRSKHRPTALLSLSDFATRSVLSSYIELGLKPAERLPMIGFDDFEFAPLLDPPLTVIRQPIAEMVRLALSLLFARIEGSAPKKTKRILCAAELICRRSCGCS